MQITQSQSSSLLFFIQSLSLAGSFFDEEKGRERVKSPGPLAHRPRKSAERTRKGCLLEGRKKALEKEKERAERANLCSPSSTSILSSFSFLSPLTELSSSHNFCPAAAAAAAIRRGISKPHHIQG